MEDGEYLGSFTAALCALLLLQGGGGRKKPGGAGCRCCVEGVGPVGWGGGGGS